MSKVKFPLPLNMPSKRNQQNFWSFYPSEPFKNGHFNVRYPVGKKVCLVGCLSLATQRNFPISFKHKVAHMWAIAKLFWKMQRKTCYSILGLNAMPLSLKNLLWKESLLLFSVTCFYNVIRRYINYVFTNKIFSKKNMNVKSYMAIIVCKSWKALKVQIDKQCC